MLIKDDKPGDGTRVYAFFQTNPTRENQYSKKGYVLCTVNLRNLSLPKLQLPPPDSHLWCR